jgi:hypothetical protein
MLGVSLGFGARAARADTAVASDGAERIPSGESGGAFELLQKKADSILETDRYEGWGYLVSGGAALAISIPAYYLTDDVFAKAIYSVTETLGVAAVGYGSYLVLVDNEMSRFVRIVKSVPKLSRAQENQLAASYLRENADRARGVRKIRVISHALTAALNFVNAATSSNQNLAEALYFVGGVNTLAALGFAISKSDEEKAGEAGLHADVIKPKLEFFAGPVSGLALRF